MLTSLLKPEIKTWFEKSAASELYANRLYQHIANQLQRLGLFGTQKYFLKESADELTHYQKLVDYVNDMGSVLSVPSVETITDAITGIETALMLAYETEVELLRQYQKFYEEAEDKYKDSVTATFIIEFLQIQRVSVGEYGDLISRFNLNRNDVFEFDEEMGEK